MYEEFIADLNRKGMGGIVKQIEELHYYKNESLPKDTGSSCTKSKTKNETIPTQAISKNERAAVGHTAARLPIEVNF